MILAIKTRQHFVQKLPPACDLQFFCSNWNNHFYSLLKNDTSRYHSNPVCVIVRACMCVCRLIYFCLSRRYWFPMTRKFGFSTVETHGMIFIYTQIRHHIRRCVACRTEFLNNYQWRVKVVNNRVELSAARKLTRLFICTYRTSHYNLPVQIFPEILISKLIFQAQVTFTRDFRITFRQLLISFSFFALRFQHYWTQFGIISDNSQFSSDQILKSSNGMEFSE